MRAFEKPRIGEDRAVKLDGWGWSFVVLILLALGVLQVVEMIVEVISSVV